MLIVVKGSTLGSQVQKLCVRRLNLSSNKKAVCELVFSVVVCGEVTRLAWVLLVQRLRMSSHQFANIAPAPQSSSAMQAGQAGMAGQQGAGGAQVMSPNGQPMQSMGQFQLIPSQLGGNAQYAMPQVGHGLPGQRLRYRRYR